MKKLVTTLLLILPILLIYFVSWVGKIVANYQKINVESISVIDSNGEEVWENKIIYLGLGDEFEFEISISPELASIKDYSFALTDSSIVALENNKVTAIKYGETVLTISSMDDFTVKTTVIFLVRDTDIKKIEFADDEIDLTVGASINANYRIYSETTDIKNKNIIWSSSDESICKVVKGRITAVSTGTCVIRAQSDYIDTVYDELIVNVSNVIDFDYSNKPGTLIINTNTIDLNSILEIDALSYSNLTFTANYSYIDQDQIQNGILVFDKENKPATINVSVEINSKIYTASITVVYVNNSN